MRWHKEAVARTLRPFASAAGIPSGVREPAPRKEGGRLSEVETPGRVEGDLMAEVFVGLLAPFSLPRLPPTSVVASPSPPGACQHG